MHAMFMKELFKYGNFFFKFLSAPKICRKRHENLSYAASKTDNALLHIMEFGVYRGESLNHLADIFYPEIIWGFDSFKGLPEDWQKTRDVIRKKGVDFALKELPKVRENARLVEGWFKDTLPRWLDEHAGDIRFLHIDSDLYSSARTILNLMDHRIKENTIIVFDELCDFNKQGDYKTWEQHEWKALREWMKGCNRGIEVLSRTSASAAVRVTK